MNYPDKLEIVPLMHPARGSVRVPGSKSITNRALVLAALSTNGGDTCELRGALQSEDTEVMVLALSALGFRIAEEDLKLRGPGELLGQQQSGAPRLRFGDLVKDLDLIRRARELSAQLVEG